MTGRRTTVLGALGIAGTLLFTACGQAVDDDRAGGTGAGATAPDGPVAADLDPPDTDPADVDAPHVDPGLLPPTATGSVLWEAPFDGSVQQMGEAFVGLRYPAGDDPMLRVRVVGSDGRIRFDVPTNPACAGYGLTVVDDRDALVVLHSDAGTGTDGIATVTTATAYDLETGADLWGPVEVPGPMRGPGLIFGESAGSIVGGEQGSRVMLAASTGEVVADEATGVVPLYEHDGIAIVEEDGVRAAVDTSTDAVVWGEDDLPVPPGADAAQGWTLGSASSGPYVSIDWKGTDGAVTPAVHHARTGRVLASGLPAELESLLAVDETTGTVVAASPGETGFAVAVDESGTELWRHPAGRVGEVSVLGAGVGYGTLPGGGGFAVDLDTAEVVDEGTWIPPQAVTPDAVMLLGLGTEDDGTERLVAIR